MKSQEFVQRKLIDLTVLFPNILIRYQIDKYHGISHVVEIMPFDIYENDDYMTAETNFEAEFYKLFPNEEIMFISEQSITKITKPIFELSGNSKNVEFDIEINHQFRYDFIVSIQGNVKEIFSENILLTACNSHEYALAA